MVVQSYVSKVLPGKLNRIGEWFVACCSIIFESENNEFGLELSELEMWKRSNAWYSPECCICRLEKVLSGRAGKGSMLKVQLERD